LVAALLASPNAGDPLGRFLFLNKVSARRNICGKKRYGLLKAILSNDRISETKPQKDLCYVRFPYSELPAEAHDQVRARGLSVP
jgi:hypothetical protein